MLLRTKVRVMVLRLVLTVAAIMATGDPKAGSRVLRRRGPLRPDDFLNLQPAAVRYLLSRELPMCL